MPSWKILGFTPADGNLDQEEYEVVYLPFGDMNLNDLTVYACTPFWSQAQAIYRQHSGLEPPDEPHERIASDASAAYAGRM